LLEKPIFLAIWLNALRIARRKPPVIFAGMDCGPCRPALTTTVILASVRIGSYPEVRHFFRMGFGLDRTSLQVERQGAVGQPAKLEDESG
jgi:hypothetical protein